MLACSILRRKNGWLSLPRKKVFLMMLQWRIRRVISGVPKNLSIKKNY
jgi:hypothetical protein